MPIAVPDDPGVGRKVQDWRHQSLDFRSGKSHLLILMIYGATVEWESFVAFGPRDHRFDGELMVGGIIYVFHLPKTLYMEKQTSGDWKRPQVQIIIVRYWSA